MKNIKIFYFIAAIVVSFAAFVSCGEKQDPAVELTLSSETLQLASGAADVVNILTGNGDYKIASNDDPTVATARITDKVITVTAVAEGKTKITVSDAKNKSKTINVTVIETTMFQFLVNGEVVPDGSTVTECDIERYEGNIMLVKSSARIQKTGEGEVEAILRISVDGSSNANAGYCGWGYDDCKTVFNGTSLESSKIVIDNEIIDPGIEILGTQIDASTYLKVKYELIYADKIQTLYWIAENIEVNPR
ncbi:MAG: hypothetical protein LBS01_07145 [Prevotellaceae bacterium]|jgi:hypothetical protein|nr:hypothetical protein [Prevotellaceae bacterium]